jgi:hypothetical protein
MSVLNFLTFLEGEADDKELAFTLECWVKWSEYHLRRTIPDAFPAGNISNCLNDYSKLCLDQGGPVAEAQTRVLDVWHHLVAKDEEQP